MADPETVNAVDELENERSESGYRFVRPPIQSMSGIRLRITTEPAASMPARLQLFLPRSIPSSSGERTETLGA